MNKLSNLNLEFKTKFQPKKKLSRKLSRVYSDLGFSKRAKTVYKCAEFCDYDVKLYQGEEFTTLSHCYFCKDVLCPLCAWRRELKLYHQVSRVLDVLNSSGDFSFLFVTLTCKNIPNSGHALKDTLNTFNKAYSNLVRRDRVKSFLRGAFRAIEVTYDGEEYISPIMYKRKNSYYKSVGLSVGDKNPTFDTLHPHLHLIWVVDKSYFQSDYYLSQRDLCDLWQQALNVDYIPLCDIRAITGKRFTNRKGKLVSYDLNSAVAEVCKYIT